MHAKIGNRLVKSLLPKEQPFEVFDTEIRGFLLRVEPSGLMTYYLAYRTAQGPGRRYRLGPRGDLTVAQARDLAGDCAARVRAGEDIQGTRQRDRAQAERAKVRTLAGFLTQKYEPWVLVERKTGAQTLKRIRSNFAKFLDKPLADINTWVIEKWRAEQIKKGKNKTTINRDVVALKAALSKALAWELIDVHPLARFKPIKTDRRAKVRYLSMEEGERLHAALLARDRKIKTERASANDWRRARDYPLYPDLSAGTYGDHLTPMVLLSLNTGLRQGEVFALTWQNVNFVGRTLTIEGAAAKSGETRHIPLNQTAMTALKAWRQQSASKHLVFPGQDGARLDNVRKAWAGVLADAHIVAFRWHDLRHDFASKLVMAGVALNTVRELLGHVDLNTTLRYAHLSPGHRAEAVEKLQAPRLADASDGAEMVAVSQL